MSSALATTDKGTNRVIDGKRVSRRLRGENTLLLQLEDADPVAKKPRKKKSDFKLPFDDLCGGVIQVIYSMLKDPRELFNLSQCSKRLRSLVAYEHVIRAAIFHPGQHSTNIIAKIVNLVNHQYIFVPTVQRLLRLVNGTCCERGKFD